MKCAQQVGLVIACGMAASTHAATWTVDDDATQFPLADFHTLQDAVDAASSGDTILVYPGVYTDDDHPYVRVLHVVSFDEGHFLEIRAVGSPEETVIDGEDSNGCVFLQGTDTTISGFTITRSSGDGVYIFGSGKPRIDNCVIEQNAGSGVFNYLGTPHVTCSVMRENEATCGGGMYSIGVLSPCQRSAGGDEDSERVLVEDCKIVDNTAELSGGGLYFVQHPSQEFPEELPIVRGCLIQGNVVTTQLEPRGGGISCNTADVRIIDCRIRHNSPHGVYGEDLMCPGYGGPTVLDSVLCDNPPAHIAGNANDGGGNVIASVCCDADVTGDNIVNVDDLLEAVGCMGGSGGCACGDADADGQVSVDDILAILSGFGCG